MQYLLRVAALVMLLLSFSATVFKSGVFMVCATLFFGLSVAALLFLRKRMLPLVFCFLLLSVYCLRLFSVLGTVEKNSRFYGQEAILTVAVNDSCVRSESDLYCVTGTVILSSVEMSDGLTAELYFRENSDIGDGDTVRVSAVLYPPENTPEGLRSCADDTVISAFVTGQPAVLSSQEKLSNFSASLRRFITGKLEENTQNAPVLSAMLSGNRGGLVSEEITLFRKAGVSHLLVVSGLHLSVLYGAVWFFCSVFSLMGLAKDLVSVIFAFGMMCLCGFSPSVMRAGVLYFVLMVCHRIGRVTDGITVLFTALTAVLLFSPLAVFSLSFLLTFSATFGILVLYPVWQKKIDSLTANCPVLCAGLKLGAVSLAASLFTAPVVLCAFGKLSLVSVFTNILVAYPVTGLLLSGAAALLLSGLPVIGLVAKPFFLFSDFCCTLVRKIVVLFASFPLAEVNVRYPRLLAVLICVGIVCLLQMRTCFIRPCLVQLKKRLKGEYDRAHSKRTTSKK